MAAYADGVMHPSEKDVLLNVCRTLNISKHEFDHLCAMIGGMHSVHQQVVMMVHLR